MITLNNSNIDFGFEDESIGSKYSIYLSRDTSNFLFKTDDNERMTIMKNGKVGIGKTETIYNLDVNGSINTGSYLINGKNISTITSDTSNYVETTSNILVGRIVDTSNYVETTSNILVGRIVDTSNYVASTSNTLVRSIIDTSNYVESTSNILVGRISDTSNYVEIASNILVHCIIDTINYARVSSNNLIISINDTSNYIDITSNTLVRRIMNTSNYVKDTSNILIGRIVDTSNYVGITSNILVGRIVDTSNYVTSTSNILVGRIVDTSNYVGITSNILVGRISDTSNYVKITSNILVRRIIDTINYVRVSSNNLIVSINDTSNYIDITSNTLVRRIMNTSNYVRDTSNILVGSMKNSNTSNYISTTSNILVNLIKSSITTLAYSELWTTSTINIYYTSSNVGIGTNNPVTNLHLYDNISKTTKLTIQNNKTTITGTPNVTAFSGGLSLSSTTITGTTESLIVFPYNSQPYTFTTDEVLNCDILLVGGGGGGGPSEMQGASINFYMGGGGGAGGYVYLTNTILPIGTYTVTVGEGKRGIINGSDSKISGPINYIAYGGGYGGDFSYGLEYMSGGEGGSGGGACFGSDINYIDYVGGRSLQELLCGYGNGGNGNNIFFTDNQRYPSFVAGGGGGAGGFISNGNYNNSNNTFFTGNGVNGLSNSITGNLVTYAGGGGGATFGIISNNGGSGGGGNGSKTVYGLQEITNPNGTVATDGEDGLGGGGGGGYRSNGGTKGGNGVVIIRYKKYQTKLSSMELIICSATDNIIDYKIGNYDGVLKITSSTLGIPTDRLVINNNGYVGIGTTNPKYRLDIERNSNPSASFTSGIYFDFDILNTITSKTLTNMCAKFNGSIWITGNCYGTSDIRIKEDIKDINNDSALQKILEIEPKTYKYIDKIENGNKKVYGFIAQQVHKVIPEAVSIENAYIPNIMMLADYNENIITLPYIPSKVVIKIKDKIKCYDINNNLVEVEVTEIINDLSFKIKDLNKKYKNNKIFVYGTFVNDFHTLSKEYIYTLNVGATQELYRQIKEQDNIIKSHKRINALQKQNKDLNEKYEMLLKEITLIKQRINR